MSKLFPNYIINVKKGIIFSKKYKKEIANKPDENGYCQTTIHDCYGNLYQARHQVIYAEANDLPKHLWPTEPNGRRYIVDHIKPLRNGGTDTFENLHLIPKPDNNRNPYSRINYSDAFKNPSAETRKKISEARKGKKHTEEIKKKISESLKGKVSGKNNGFYNHHRTKEEIDKIIKAVKEKLSIKVYQCTLDNNLIKIWDSASEADRNGYTQGSVSACCRGERKTHKGFKWMYKEDYEKMLGE